MSVSTPKREYSPVATRVTTSLANSMLSPNKNVKLSESHYFKSSKNSKKFDYGSTWKLFVLPQFRQINLGQSLSTIPTPQYKKGMLLRQNQTTKSKYQIKMNDSGIRNRSFNEFLYSEATQQQPLGTTYLRQQVQYLRTQFSEVLRQKYRPHCKTLYD